MARHDHGERIERGAEKPHRIETALAIARMGAVVGLPKLSRGDGRFAARKSRS